MSSPAPRRTSMTSRLIGWGLGMLAVFAVMYLSFPKKDGPQKEAGSQVVNSGVNRSQCEDRLAKWLNSVDPLRHQLNIDMDGRMSELNRYWETCGPKSAEPIVTDLKPIEGALSGEKQELTLSKRFSRRDIEHIRQSILMSRVAIRLAEGKKTDRERANGAMTLISQQLEPVPQAAATNSPLPPFESLILGKGTASDRAWLLAEVLRQLGLDCMVFVHADPQVDPLVGVVLDADVLLYDPLTGFPVPAAGENQRKTLFQEPARLADAIAEDGILRQLDVEGRRCPWTADSLKVATVGVVGTTCTWSPRMAELQFQWVGSEKCALYDGLGPSSLSEKGLLTRVQEAVASAGFSADRVKIWDYPEQRSEKYLELGAEAAPHMAAVLEMMSGPTVVEGVTDAAEGVRGLRTVRSKQPLQMVRVQQLIGNRDAAIQGYLPLTRAHRAPAGYAIPADMQKILDQNRPIADRATYWLASTQFENGDIQSCADTLRRYRREFALGQMTEAALMRLAACLVRAGENAKALEVLKALGPGPNQWRRALLVKRLEELNQTSEGKPAETEAPADPAPAESQAPATTEGQPVSQTLPSEAAPAVEQQP